MATRPSVNWQSSPQQHTLARGRPLTIGRQSIPYYSTSHHSHVRVHGIVINMEMSHDPSTVHGWAFHNLSLQYHTPQ